MLSASWEVTPKTSAGTSVRSFSSSPTTLTSDMSGNKLTELEPVEGGTMSVSKTGANMPVQPQVVDEIPRIQTILALVASGAGIALLPTSFINLHRQGVQFRPLREPLPYRPLALAWRSDNQSPSLMRFIEVARSTSTYYLNDLAQRYPQLRPEQTP